MFTKAQVPSILMLGLVYVTYVLIGGVIFWKLEGELGKKDISVLLLNKKKLLTTYPCMNQEGLEAVAQVSTLQLAPPLQSTVFLPPKGDDILTVYSFAGYGNMSPSTTAGQIFCVFFALIGIPLNMVVLNRVGKYMLAIERDVSDFLEGKTGQRWEHLCMRFSVHLVSYLCGTVLFFIVPMIVFQQHEGWTHSQAIYYCFITLSTIGFGDFVAGTTVIQTKNTLTGTASSWPCGSSLAWPGWPCLSTTRLTSWRDSTPTSNSGGSAFILLHVSNSGKQSVSGGFSVCSSPD
uniref:Potassium channel, subfamily K, member 17 n=1 Tax=Stegastes partitus TaxID=144197 RepID=A0A3B4Z6P6_9TELE